MDFNNQRDFKTTEEAGDTIPPIFDAVLIIDAQEKYAKQVPGHGFYWGTHETEAVASHIGKLSKIFRDAGVPIYAAYFVHDDIPAKDRTSPSDIDFYGYEYHKGDILVRKTENSALDGTGLLRTFEYNKHKNILVLGFNTAACIHDTVVEALNNRVNCWVVTDSIGNGVQQDDRQREECMRSMNMEGAKFVTTKQALSRLSDAIAGVKLQIPKLTAAQTSEDAHQRHITQVLRFGR